MWQSVQVHVEVYLSMVVDMFGHYPLAGKTIRSIRAKEEMRFHRALE